jgi:hypothetical protein
MKGIADFTASRGKSALLANSGNGSWALFRFYDNGLQMRKDCI